jgi:membrane associated rhomboid family serine protease
MSWVLSFSIICFSIYLLFSGSTTPTLDIITSGAWEASLIGSGEVDRLLSYSLIHGNMIHLASNMLGLLLLGLALEHRIGKLNFLTAFFAGVVVSSLGAYLSSHVIVIGASGGAYALLGVYVFDRYLEPDPNNERFKSTTNTRIILAVIVESIISLFFTNIALGVHLIGFAFGVSYALIISKPNFRFVARVLFGVPVLILTAMFILRFISANAEYKHELSQNWLAANDHPIRNQIAAWEIATSPLSTQDSISIAIQTLEKDHDDTSSLDTRATLYARTGRLADAIAIEDAIIYNLEIYGSQLARFERAYTKTNPIDISKFAESETIAIDAICDNKRFVRVHTNQTDKIHNICNNQEIIYIREAEAGSKSIRYDLDPKFMALPL